MKQSGTDLPRPRGPLSAFLRERLQRDVHALSPVRVVAQDGALDDDDLQLALYICYELHYHGWQGVPETWEWEPSLLALRARLENALLDGLRHAVGPMPDRSASFIPGSLQALVDADDAPSLSRYLARRASLEQFREFVIQRSVYHLREADPHSWGIPRLQGRAKAALVEIQMDEYGNGQLERMHAELFRTTMGRLGLRTGYRAYVDHVPAVTLATNNVMSLFGLHRRWLGALLGHLAAFEMTSSLPNRRYGNGLRRLGGDRLATRFFDEHIQADAVYEQIAARDLCGAYVHEHPGAEADVLFGAAAALTMDGLMARHILDRWNEGRTSLAVETDVVERVAA